MDTDSETRLVQWFVMRDLTRSNAKLPAYLLLAGEGIECFTPMVPKLRICQGKRERVEAPFIHDLLFVHSTQEALDPVVLRTRTLQFRYLRGVYHVPMTVNEKEMSRFINAVRATDSPRYYLPDEVTPAMCKRRIRIIGGPLNGYEGTLVTTRGSKARRLLVQLPNLLAMTVEVNPEYIQLL